MTEDELKAKMAALEALRQNEGPIRSNIDYPRHPFVHYPWGQESDIRGQSVNLYDPNSRFPKELSDDAFITQKQRELQNSQDTDKKLEMLRKLGLVPKE